MNKHTLRAFSFGMIFAVSATAAYNLNFAKENPQKVNISTAKQILNKDGYVILPKAEFKKLTEQAPKPKIEETKKNTETTDNRAGNSTQSSIINYQLTIDKGMGTNQIGIILAAAKIIDDKKAFEEYLVSNNYQTRIQLGTYDLTNNMGYEQIAKIITKSK
jgi:hypothetical protein